jgi:flavodoxin I
MKVLVTYFSQTGNTEKIAIAIHEEASKNHEVQSKQLKNINAADLVAYDFIFIGSPLHGGNLAGPVKEFLTSIKSGAGKKIAGFITHAADAYPDQDMDKFSEPIKTACKATGMEYKGCFDCQGFLTEALHEMIKKSQKLTDEQWAARVAQMTGHPDAKDIQNAKAFTKIALTQ